MGKGPKRRKKDVVMITAQNENSGSETPNSSDTHTKECPPSFRVVLPEDKQLVSGMALSLIIEGSKIFIYANLKKIQSLSSSRTKEISNCLRDGYRYPGNIVKEKDGKKYGEFIRRTK